MQKLSLREGTAISNLDGRLWDEVGTDTGQYFGDEAVVRTRIDIEARYLIALSKAGVIRKLTAAEIDTLKSLHNLVTPKVYLKVRKIEAGARHDVIAMTLVMKDLLSKREALNDILNSGWIHWGLASEDVDNLSKAVLTSEFIRKVYLPRASSLLKAICALSDKCKDTVIASKTHLQPAVPTILGKEIALFGIRLSEEFAKIKKIKLRGKLTGAVGNLSAQRFAYPEINWLKFSSDFVESLGLEANLFTTQIEPRNRWADLLDAIETVNLILINLSQDARLYAGFEWFIQEAKTKEFGSSAMPQKVNPIDFENSHGNALISNWLTDGLKKQLLVSWLQRDLVDKTILRNLGLPFGHSLIAIISCQKGLERVSPNSEKIKNDLESDWGILAEAYQTFLRSVGQANAYDELKNLTRGKKITKDDILNWIAHLKVPEQNKRKLKAIGFTSYVGYARVNLVKMQRLIKKTISSL